MIDNEGLKRPLGEHFEQLKEMGAGCATTSFENEAEEPVAAIILVRGVPETQQALDALEAVTEAWADDRPVPDPGKLLDLLHRAADLVVKERGHYGDWIDWYRDYYEATGKHMVLVQDRYGAVWVSPEDAREYPEEAIHEVVNAPESHA